MSGLFDDLLQSCRLLRRHVPFTVLATLLFGLGMGAAAVLFSVCDALLLRPLPVLEPDRLVRPVRVRIGGVGPLSDFREEVYLAWKQRAQSLLDVSASIDLNAVYHDGELPERVRVQAVSSSYFSVFGVGASLGRVLHAVDDEPGTDTRAAVLSFDFWRRRYQEDTGILGRRVLVQGHPFFIAGVLPKGFSGENIDLRPDVRISLPSSAALLFDGDSLRYDIVARLRNGVSLSSARDEANGLFRSTMDAVLAQHPDTDDRVRAYELPGDFRLEPIPRGISRLRTQYAKALTLSMAGAGVLLLMLCANISGLLLARYVARKHEFALRLAIGAPHWRLFRLSIIECLLLASLGSLAGLVLAHAMLPLVVRALPPMRLLDATTVPLALQISLDHRVAAFAMLLGLIAALITGFAPALQAARTSLGTMLREATASYSSRARSLLLMTQVALCVVLVASAGLLIDALHSLRTADPGFALHSVVSFSIDPNLAVKSPKPMQALLQRLLAEVKTLPGVEQASFSSRPLLRGTGLKVTVAPAGQRAGAADFMNTSIHVVSAEYFSTVGLQITMGRTYTPADLLPTPAGTPRPAVVNQAFVRRFFAGALPLGQRFGTTGQKVAKPDYEIIGIVSDARYRSLREPVPPTVYQPLRLNQSFPGVLYVRTTVAPSTIIQPLRQLFRRIAPQLPLTEVTTLHEDVESSLWPERAIAAITGAFSLFAMLIVAVGLYASISFLVSQRTREIGIRKALGASHEDICASIAKQTAGLVGGGGLVGIAIWFLARPAMASLLYEPSPTELGPLILAVGLIIAVTLAAIVFPVIRAVRIEPSSALRHDG